MNPIAPSGPAGHTCRRHVPSHHFRTALSARPAGVCSRPPIRAVFFFQRSAMGYKIGVIGGDGIGPEVVAEALKVVRAAGRRPRHRRLRPGRRPLPARRARSCPTPCSTSCGASTPSCSARSATPSVPPGIIERGLLLRMRFELDLYVNLRPFRTAFSVVRENTEGVLRRRGRVPAQGHAGRGGHPGLGEHPHGRRALRALRLRPGPRPGPAATSPWSTRPTC